jgi:hypothetical protein
VKFQYFSNNVDNEFQLTAKVALTASHGKLHEMDQLLMDHEGSYTTPDAIYNMAESIGIDIQKIQRRQFRMK